MRSNPFVPVQAALCLALLAYSAAASGQQFDATADTYTRTNAPAENFGTEALVRVQPWGDMYGFVKFDLDPLAGARAASAVLVLTVDDVKAAGNLRVHKALGAWGETSLTRNNQPLVGPMVATAPLTLADDGREVLVDVTVLVNEWLLQPATDFGLVLTQGGANAWIRSRESATPARLLVSLDSAPRTLAVTGDSYTRTNARTTNFGSDPDVRVQPWGSMTGFIRFDLSSLSGLALSNVELVLPVRDVKVDGPVRVHKVLGDWSETTITDANRPTFGPVMTSFSVSRADNGRDVAVDVTSLVSELLSDPSGDFGIALTQAGANAWFDSRESGNPIQLVATAQDGSANAAPQVHAGPDAAVLLPASANLAGSVADDGLPSPPGVVTATWAKVSGPGTVTFGNANLPQTTASFSLAGIYVLRLTANDGELLRSDDVSMTVAAAPVNQPPAVDAGPDFSAVPNTTVVVTGAVSDDGLPDPPGSVSVHWSKLTGPGTVTLTSASATTTGVRFSQSGTYVLRLQANDGQYTVTDDVAVTVTANGVPHTVNALADTYTRSNAVSSNFGAETLVRVQPWGDMAGFAHFDLSGLASNSVSTATLRLRMETVSTAGTLQLRRVLGTWNETTLTHANRPAIGPVEQSFTVAKADAGQVIAVDVTAIVNAMLADPLGNFGIALTQSGANAWIRSRESGSPMQLTATAGAAPMPAFTDITAGSTTGGPAWFGGHGAQFADVTGDGWTDFYVTMNQTSFGNIPELFFRNLDGSTFVEEAAARGIDNLDTGSHGGVFADFDNDGDYDLYNGSYDQNRLYRNNGSGQFTDITVAAGFPSRLWPTRGVAATDMDGDGDLDIVAINGFNGSGDPAAERNEIYRNNGNGSFTALALEPVFSAPAGQGITDADFDNDGDTDLFAANRMGDVVILRNVSGSGFELVAPANIGITHQAGDGISFADVNNDGHLDALLDDRLYLADGDGTFTFRAALTGPAIPYMGGFADLDNDGDPDIVFPGANYVYYNDGAGNFSAGPSFALGAVNDPRSVAFADIDNDGDLDFFFAQKATKNILVRNNYAGDNRWLRLQLRRANGQAGAFGARVYVYPAGQLNNAAAVLTWAEAHSQSGYLAQNDPRLLLGTGMHTQVDIKVIFPGGAVTTLQNVPTNQPLEIHE